MSIIHSALKKAELEQQKKNEPCAISVDEIIALAEKGVSPKPLAPPKPSILKRRSSILGPVSIMGAVVLVALLWFLISLTARASKNFGNTPPLTRKTVASLPSTPPPIAHPSPLQQAVKPIQSLFVTSETRDFHLSGIVSRGGKATAMINDKLVDVGDSVKDAKVVSITEKTVILERGGKNLVVHLD